MPFSLENNDIKNYFAKLHPNIDVFKHIKKLMKIGKKSIIKKLKTLELEHRNLSK